MSLTEKVVSTLEYHGESVPSMSHLWRLCSKKEELPVIFAAQNRLSFWTHLHVLFVSVLAHSALNNENKSCLVDLMTKACVLDQDASVMTWNVHLSWNSRAFLGSLLPIPIGQPKPSSSKWFRIPTLVPSLWVHNQIGATFHMWFLCLSGLAELLEGASEKAVSKCIAKVGHIVLLLEDFCLGVSFCVLLRKVVLGTCQCWFLSLQGDLWWHRCTGLFPLFSCCFGTVPIPDASDRCSRRSIWITVPSKQLFFKRSHSENTHCP